MNFSDIQMYTSIKLLLLIFLIVSIYLVHKKKKNIFFLFLVGLISATSYMLLTNNLATMLWGLQGDEITIAAMYNTFAHVGLGSDFAYHNLPPFYPSAFFWFFGLIGRMMDWNGVLIAKFASFCFFLFFPVGLYFYQIFLEKNTNPHERPNEIFALLCPLLILTVLDKDLLIGKPYEVIAAAATIFWYISLYLKISQNKWTFKLSILYGSLAGVIFMVYYLWLVFAAIALFLMGIFNKKQNKIKYFFSLFQTMCVTLLVSSPFLLPLIMSYTQFGMESWQTAFFTPKGLDLWLPMFQLTSINNFIYFFGLAVLIFFRKHNITKQLLFLFITAFIWWGAGMISLLFFKIPFQEFRGFYVLSPTLLAIAAAYGIDRIWRHFRVSGNKNLSFTITVIGILFFASQSVFGFFVDDPIVKMRRVESRYVNESIIHIVNFLKQDPLASSKLTLQTAPQLLAFIPLHHVIYFNQHNNHPAAIFSKRYAYVESLANSQTTEELYQKVINSPYGQIERFIFSGDDKYYYLYFHVDKIIQGIEEEKIKIDKTLFESDNFVKVYEKDNYTVIDVLKKNTP